jgi:hypothetical protein
MGTAQQISSVLQQAADAGDVPGVVATAANADGVVFEGGLWHPRSRLGCSDDD